MKDSLGRRHGRLHNRIFLTEIAQGNEEAVNIFLEGHQGADADHPMQHLATTVPKQKRHAHRTGGLHHRKKTRFIDVRPMVGVPMCFVEFVELPVAFLLTDKKLCDSHPGNRLCQIGVDARDPLANQAIGFPGPDAKEVNGQRHRRNQRQRDQGQLDMHVKHDHDDPDQHDEVRNQRHHPGCKHLLQHIHVRGHPGH